MGLGLPSTLPRAFAVRNAAWVRLEIIPRLYSTTAARIGMALPNWVLV